ncbi:MAG: UDP-N-acetylmuramoyl-L-alanine--D-glutamate ligase [Candidatus Omnitrophica bacterium]|nr:UDP-N-acetylmuramoyl-L-alanine--D-glutamate ligase [Candidatus Omnitrophota bacterium]
MGETGIDTALALKKLGADVYVTEIKNTEDITRTQIDLEKKGIKTEIGKHSLQFISDSFLIIPSPGVPLDALPILWAKEKNIPVKSEIEIAYQLSPSKKIVAITGTNGKTTTTSLAGLLFKNAGLPHITCGNIGNSFIGELKKIKPETIIILEVSSFQLEYIEEFRPQISVLLNITEDHLDYYETFSQYISAKNKIFINQKENDIAVLNWSDDLCRKTGDTLSIKKIYFSGRQNLKNGISLKDKKIIYFLHDTYTEMAYISKGKLFGPHNIENIMAVCGIALSMEIPSSVIQKTIEEFIPLSHRLEKIAEINGIIYINDSKATNIDAVKRALESFSSEKNIILIMGGKDKGFSFTPLTKLISEKVKYLVLLGQTAERIKKELKESSVPQKIVQTMEDAVILSSQTGKKGDIVLLSPGCSSFDMFKNYEERGDDFRRIVKNLL